MRRTTTSHIAVLDARSGRRREHVAESEAALRGLDLRSEVTDLAVTRTGTAVWIIKGERPRQYGYELRRARWSDRHTTLADSGQDVAPGSLAPGTSREELRAVRVRAGVGRRQRAALDLVVVELVIERVARAAAAGTACISTGE